MDFLEFEISDSESLKRALIAYFRHFRPLYPGMAKESSPQTFPIDLFVKRACHVAKISREYNGWYMYNSLLT